MEKKLAKQLINLIYTASKVIHLQEIQAHEGFTHLCTAIASIFTLLLNNSTLTPKSRIHFLHNCMKSDSGEGWFIRNILLANLLVGLFVCEVMQPQVISFLIGVDLERAELNGCVFDMMCVGHLAFMNTLTPVIFKMYESYLWTSFVLYYYLLMMII